MTTRKDSEAASVPTASPEPECNTGYAEPKPRDKAQAVARRSFMAILHPERTVRKVWERRARVTGASRKVSASGVRRASRPTLTTAPPINEKGTAEAMPFP